MSFECAGQCCFIIYWWFVCGAWSLSVFDFLCFRFCFVCYARIIGRFSFGALGCVCGVFVELLWCILC